MIIAAVNAATLSIIESNVQVRRRCDCGAGTATSLTGGGSVDRRVSSWLRMGSRFGVGRIDLSDASWPRFASLARAPVGALVAMGVPRISGVSFAGPSTASAARECDFHAARSGRADDSNAVRSDRVGGSGACVRRRNVAREWILSRRASIAASPESTSSHGWKGWSGSDDFPMRRAGEAPMFCVGASETCGGDESAAAVASAGCTELASASGARRHRALPSASVVKTTSPPP
eukprot:6208675-Pleurochrysis_carterae.AAC.1